MLDKKLTSTGQKAYQRMDKEDRSLPYRDWLRTVDVNGYFLDIDFIKWKRVGNDVFPVAITELTRCDSSTVGEAYRQAIIDRLFIRDSQGKTIEKLGFLLHVPVYLVLFNKDMAWLWVYSFSRKEWQRFTPSAWADFLKSL